MASRITTRWTHSKTAQGSFIAKILLYFCYFVITFLFFTFFCFRSLCCSLLTVFYFFHVILVATVSLSFLACSLWAVLKMQEIENWSALPFNQYTDMKMWCGRSRGAVDGGELDVWKEGKCLREPKIQWCRAISCICYILYMLSQCVCVCVCALSFKIKYFYWE